MRSAFLVLSWLALVPPVEAGERPGFDRGTTLLPNGWRIAPVGKHVAVGDLPLAMVLSPDGRFVIVTNNGYEKPTLSVVDLEKQNVRQTFPLENAWLGLAFDPAG